MTEVVKLGATLIGAIEDFWLALAAEHAELPRSVVAVTGSGHRPRALVYGHWAPELWSPLTSAP